MMTAVDTNVLFDVFYEPTEHSQESAEALRQAYDRGGLCISYAVYAELSPRFESRALLEAGLRELGIVVVADDAEVGWLAGQAWAAYRKSGGPRNRILTDFLIGAHSLVNADALLTRDRGFYREHFTGLTVIEP
jgi:hypothetical protein